MICEICLLFKRLFCYCLATTSKPLNKGFIMLFKNITKSTLATLTLVAGSFSGALAADSRALIPVFDQVSVRDGMLHTNIQVCTHVGESAEDYKLEVRRSSDKLAYLEVRRKDDQEIFCPRAAFSVQKVSIHLAIDKTGLRENARFRLLNPRYNTNRPIVSTKPNFNTNRPVVSTKPNFNTNRPVVSTKPNFNTNRPVVTTKPNFDDSTVRFQ